MAGCDARLALLAPREPIRRRQTLTNVAPKKILTVASGHRWGRGAGVSGWTLSSRAEVVSNLRSDVNTISASTVPSISLTSSYIGP